MPANIESMAYTGTTPWHQLGVKVDHAMNSAEALTLAGLDWPVEMRPVYYRGDGGQMVEIPDRRAAIRPTDGQVFEVLSDEFKPLQNLDAFVFFDSIVGDGAAVYETAGSLLGGRKVWILARLTSGVIEVVKSDVVEPYLLLANGHDGTMALWLGFTPIRVVCCNTLRMAIGGFERQANRAVSVYHRGNLRQQLDQAAQILGIVRRGYDEIAERMRRWAATQIRSRDLRKYVTLVYPDSPRQSEQEAERLERVRDRVLALAEGGRGMNIPGVRGTLWGAYNAVVEHVDFQVRTSPERRLHSAWFGTGAQVKGQAAAIADAIAGNAASHRDLFAGFGTN